MDRSTLDTLLKRSLNSHSSLEQMARDKQAAIQQMQAQFGQLNEDLRRLQGAIEFSGIVVKGLRDDLATLDAMQAAAAKAAAEQAALTRQPEEAAPSA